MQDKFAVFMTLNGEIIEWRIFDSQDFAYKHYNEGIEKLREVLQTSNEGDWQIMMCNINQYAVSKPHAEPTSNSHSIEWQHRYANVLATKAKRITHLPSSLTLQAWRALRKGMSKTLTKPNVKDEPIDSSGA